MGRMKRLRKGDPISRFPADSWNAMAAKIDELRRELTTIEDLRKPKDKSPVIVRLVWDGADPIEPGACVKLGNSAFDPTTDDSAQFSGVTFHCDEFASLEAHPTECAITLGEIAGGGEGVGYGVLTGDYWAKVNITDAGHTGASILAAGSLLGSAQDCGFPIIWKPSGTGEKWCVISLTPPDRLVAADTTDNHPRELYDKIYDHSTYDPESHQVVYAQVVASPTPLDPLPDNLIRLFTAIAVVDFGDFEAGCGIDVTAGIISVDNGDLAGLGLVPAETGCALDINYGCGLTITDDVLKVDLTALAGEGLTTNTVDDACELEVDMCAAIKTLTGYSATGVFIPVLIDDACELITLEELLKLLTGWSAGGLQSIGHDAAGDPEWQDDDDVCP